MKSRYVLLLSGIYGGLLFILEPNIFLVGILGIITLFFVNFLSINNHFYKNIKIYFKEFVLFFLLPSVIIISYFLFYLHANESLISYFNFFKSFPDMEISSSWPVTNANFYGSKDFILFLIISLQGGFVTLSMFDKKLNFFLERFLFRIIYNYLPFVVQVLY